MVRNKCGSRIEPLPKTIVSPLPHDPLDVGICQPRQEMKSPFDAESKGLCWLESEAYPYFLPALIFAHRAVAAAEIFARAAALILRLLRVAGFAGLPLPAVMPVNKRFN